MNKLLKVFSAALVLTCAFNNTSKSNKILDKREVNRAVVPNIDLSSSYNWVNDISVENNGYTYNFYYDLNTKVDYEIYTGISYEAVEGFDDELEYSTSAHYGISIETGVTTTYSEEASLKVLCAEATLETSFEASFGFNYVSEYDETIHQELSHNDKDGFGTYYLYRISFVSTYKIEKVKRGVVVETKIINNASMKYNDDYSLAKKQPKIILPLLSVC